MHGIIRGVLIASVGLHVTVLVLITVVVIHGLLRQTPCGACSLDERSLCRLLQGLIPSLQLLCFTCSLVSFVLKTLGFLSCCLCFLHLLLCFLCHLICFNFLSQQFRSGLLCKPLRLCCLFCNLLCLALRCLFVELLLRLGCLLRCLFLCLSTLLSCFSLFFCTLLFFFFLGFRSSCAFLLNSLTLLLSKAGPKSAT